MAIHRLPMSLNKKCTFYRLMGSGRNGTFDLSPDLQQWALLAVWKNQEDFDAFYSKSFISRWWTNFTQEKWTVLCEPLISHGTWDNQTPFGKDFNQTTYNGPIAVLTRATIRLSKLKGFWSNVDPVAQLMLKAKGYITSFGIGEAPVYKQATFSVWQSAEDVKAFAYGSAEHREVIKKTREENWYSEELFARFKIIKSMGALSGKDPLENII
ncbi:DUF3291 domain-containing protein [Arcticibacter eurypsychrophilus]|uniref:DUF3291 domain-containing protein n=1 Tax=Arcticibacter eurypsychrophilus TaxID=1434752 RepID=UPI0009F1F48B|nr:DUF3291 domain-containing protein [Arcticibacter eurypsychrophilus]